ncbi:hypothetical protein ACVW19_004020 [Streptomyces sp. TE5632]
MSKSDISGWLVRLVDRGMDDAVVAEAGEREAERG